jgi:Zn finger protein HypA/HybF involved in hydrogenase expression
MSLALEVCRMAEAHVGREQLARVVAVGVEVGDDAGVEPDNLGFCLEVLLSNPPFRHARPEIQRQRGDAICLRYLELDDELPGAAGEAARPAAEGPS